MKLFNLPATDRTNYSKTRHQTRAKCACRQSPYRNSDAHLMSSNSFVCALSERTNTLVTFTSYQAPRVDRELLDQTTILQACRATSATSSFFDPLVMRIGRGGAGYDDSFIDGALGHNNPIRQLWTEAGDVWGGPLDHKIACIVSIGTGKPALGDFTSGALDMGKRLLAVSTESEMTADQFYNDHRYGLVKAHRYHRFTVERGLEKIGLEEAKEKSMIIRATKEYLKGGETFDKIQACSETLATRKSVSTFAYIHLQLETLDHDPEPAVLGSRNLEGSTQSSSMSHRSVAAQGPKDAIHLDLAASIP